MTDLPAEAEAEPGSVAYRRSWATWTRAALAAAGGALLLVAHAALAYNVFVRPLPWTPPGLTYVSAVFAACVLAPLLALPAWNRWSALSLPVGLSAAVVNQVFARMTVTPSWHLWLVRMAIGWYWVGPALAGVLAVAAGVAVWRRGAVPVVEAPSEPPAADHGAFPAADAPPSAEPPAEVAPSAPVAPAAPAASPDPHRLTEDPFFDTDD